MLDRVYLFHVASFWRNSGIICAAHRGLFRLGIGLVIFCCNLNKVPCGLSAGGRGLAGHLLFSRIRGRVRLLALPLPLPLAGYAKLCPAAPWGVVHHARDGATLERPEVLGGQLSTTHVAGLHSKTRRWRVIPCSDSWP